MDGGSYYLNETGTPQGGVISPLLANIYLHPLDALMEERGHRLTRSWRYRCIKENQPQISD
jgi:retron-type reverse transcriptase